MKKISLIIGILCLAGIIGLELSFSEPSLLFGMGITLRVLLALLGGFFLGRVFSRSGMSRKQKKAMKRLGIATEKAEED